MINSQSSGFCACVGKKMRLAMAVGDVVFAVALFASTVLYAKGDVQHGGSNDARIAHWADTTRNLSNNFSSKPRSMSQDSTGRAYPMNYTDELAQSLGIKDGNLDLLSTSAASDRGSAPRLSAGVDRNGASFKLRW